MVLFGANHTAERFIDCDRLTAHFPGPGAYRYASRSSAVDVAPVPPRHAGKTLEDGCVRLDGSTLLFRDRCSWVRGVDGSKGLACLSVGNPFVSPAAYDTEPGERAIRRAVPTAFINTHEARYLSPSTRCLTPAHERAAKGAESPGPGKYYPFKEAWNFPPPEKWDNVNKEYWTPRRGFNTKAAWGEARTPRQPGPARAEEMPSKELAWLSKRRGLMRPSTSPRCMWVNGVSTKGGLQAWGDVATNTSPIRVGHGLDCAPRGESTPRRGPASECRNPAQYSGEGRAIPPGFREVRYLDRELARRTNGTAKNTPGPGEYNVRPSMTCGTRFAGPKANCSRAKRAASAIACANRRTTNGAGVRGGLKAQHGLSHHPRKRSGYQRCPWEKRVRVQRTICRVVSI